MGTESKPSFWTTLPGILTGIAALLTASTGFYVAIWSASGGGAHGRPVATDTASSRTPQSPPAFVRAGSMPVQSPLEYTIQQRGIQLTDPAGFLRVTDFAFGSTEGGRSPNIFKVEFVLTNTAAESILLDLTDRYFSLEDDRGQRAQLIYFCCEAHGELLSPGQSRTASAFFSSTDWYGKEIAAHAILFHVQGLLPVERATWRFPVLATAE